MTPRHRACDDFRQTSASTRRSWVDAPLTRRRLIAGGLGATLAVYAAKAMPLTRMLEAAEAQAATAPNAPILVSVFLPGGVDLLDTLVPQAAYGAYADLRKGLKLPEVPALGSTGLGLHPALSAGARGGVKVLFDAGKIGFMPGIDYANPDLSHFHSRHFWETGLITQDQVPGWLGRWLDRRGGADNPFQGMTIGSTLSPVLRSSRVPVAAVTSPDDAQFWIRDTWGEAFERGVATWGRLAEGGSAKPGPAAVRDSTKLAMQVSERLAPYRSDEEKGFYPLKPPVAYPDFEANGLARSLSQLAGLLSLPLGVRVAAVEAEGDFDTHDNQPRELDQGLRQVSEALAAFQADIEARGIADRVLTLVWSEFGRRPEGNESQGTDHGAGGVAWVQGTRARSGILTEYPSLGRLDRDGNLAVTVDFRRVYASLLEQWLGSDAGEVIPGAAGFGRLQLTA